MRYDPERPWTWPEEERERALEDREYEYQRDRRRQVMKLREYIQSLTDEVDEFEMLWMRKHRLDPVKYPLELSREGWDEQWETLEGIEIT